MPESAKTIRSMLVAVDGSAPSLAAARWALDLSRALGARLYAVFVDDDGEGGRVPKDAWPGPGDPAYARLKAGLSALEAIAAEGLQADVPTETLLYRGAIVEAILAAASDVRADGIVLGDRGLSGLRRLLLGSVAAEVVRRAKCPVTVVKAGALSQNAPKEG